MLALHPPLATPRVDFGLCLRFNRPSPLVGKRVREGAEVQLPGSGTRCGTPKLRAGTSRALGKAGRDVAGGSEGIQTALLASSHPGEAGEGAWGGWGCGGGAFCTLRSGRKEAAAEPTP